LIILTGLSGSGKGTIVKTFEDLGYYCVDNLPVDLIPTFADLLGQSGSEIAKAALVVDVREGGALTRFPRLYRKLQRRQPATLVFVEASDDALVRRFSETRRPHPLGRDKSVLGGIRAERRMMQPIRQLADVVIDTTRFNVHELRQHVVHRFQGEDRRKRILISLASFGYRWGVPPDSDLVFDVRFLPNPNFVPRLKAQSGKDPAVVRYIRSFPQTEEFIKRLTKLLVYLLPHYMREGKSYLTIAFGCTGGRHRSVAISEAIHRELVGYGYDTKVTHRDLVK
jgi:UPF0042 nucleotide-binding protein